MLVRLALDEEVGFVFQQVSRFDARMGMAPGAAPTGISAGYRLIPSKLAAMPRWNSDQSNPSASAT
jgi:hypothetical protein